MGEVTLTNEQFQQLLAQIAGNNTFAGKPMPVGYTPVNNSILGQFQGYNAQLDTLNPNAANYAQQKALLNAGKLNAGISGGLAVLGGGLDILNNTLNLASIENTDLQQGLVDDISQIGRSNYNTFDQLNSEYGRLGSMQTTFDYDDIRGKTGLQKVGNTLSSTATGALTGAQVGGPIGAIAGAVVGLGAGIGGWLVGDAKARKEQERLQNEAKTNQLNAYKNLYAANNRMSEYNFRAGVSNHAAEGGKMETIKEFADRALRRQRAQQRERATKIIRRHGEGGTIIRIKV